MVVSIAFKHALGVNMAASARTKVEKTQQSTAQTTEDRLATNKLAVDSSQIRQSLSTDATQANVPLQLLPPFPIAQHSSKQICLTQSVTGQSSIIKTSATGKTAYTITIADEEKPSSDGNSKDQSRTICSRYKFLPSLLAAASLGDRQQSPVKRKLRRTARSPGRHTKRCQVFSRFKCLPDSNSVKQIQSDDRSFLSKVEEYKKKRPVNDCHCEARWCTPLEDLLYRLGRTFRLILRLISLLCCPPCPAHFFHKLAFWPPSRDYFFFYNDDPTKEKADAVQTATIKLRRADKRATTFNNNRWRFGFEHECFAEICNVDCFVVETKTGNFLGCVLVKSPHPKPLYTLLFSHPNGSDISDHLTGVPNLQDTAAYLNCDIVAYDYSGYGISSGRPSEVNLNADIEAVYRYISKVLRITNDSIIVWGFSIGTAATVHLAIKLKNIAGVILFAPPTSIVRALCWKRCCCCQREQPCNSSTKACRMDRFCTIGKISKVTCPLLIAHGANDEMVPIEHGQALYQHSNTAVPPLWIPDVGHNNLENSELLWTRVKKFIRYEARSALQTAADGAETDLHFARTTKTRRLSSKKSKSTCNFNSKLKDQSGQPASNAAML